MNLKNSSKHLLTLFLSKQSKTKNQLWITHVLAIHGKEKKPDWPLSLIGFRKNGTMLKKIANDARSPLITEWRRKRDKLKVEVDTAEAEWTSFKSQRMDWTPDLKRKRSFTIETLEELVEEIATTPDRNRRIRLGN